MAEQLPNISRIVVPLDGSELAESAFPLAEAIASASGAHIDLVTVALTYELPAESQMDSTTLNELRRAEAELSGRLPSVGCTMLAGDPADELARHSSASNARLVVMATHGRTGWRRFLLGSVADRLVSAGTVPVLLVKAGPGGEDVPQSAVRTVLLPLDGGEASSVAAPYAMKMASLLGAEVVLLHVDEGGTQGSGERQMNAVSAECSANGLRVRSRMEDGSPADVISDIAGETEDCMVVMSSLSATGVARGTHRGSVADHVAKNADAPVLIVPPRGYLGRIVD